jgi:hypothetical protein
MRDFFGWAEGTRTALAGLVVLAAGACSDDEAGPVPDGDTVDITNEVFTNRSADCAEYASVYEAFVTDLGRNRGFESAVTFSSTEDDCTLVSNDIPNHDFNDDTAHFATPVAEVDHTFVVVRAPALAGASTALAQNAYNGVMLNGVPIDLLSAGCYDPTSPMADADGNVAIGCGLDRAWRLDPLGTDHKFGADAHNAHTQPDGSYHYHGNPNAMFDDEPGPNGSPVIGFAADGFPIYGSWFLDASSGAVRKAISGYTLKPGARPTGTGDPGGTYDGMYVDDWEFTGAGDLDACNGMTVDGQYGYYVTDTYPWILGCLSGTPHDSFVKG